MIHFLHIFTGVLVLTLLQHIPALGVENTKEQSSQTLNTNSSSGGSHILLGTLLNIEGDFWLVKDKTGNHHRVHIGPDTIRPHSPKETGDSIGAVVRKNGHALLIQ